ncbi:hypothetical protein TNCV_3215801 [Trichonephila clavipes]|nr:hypothetical protein TNCV_3215801 [Trichonephila clavipes]
MKMLYSKETARLKVGPQQWITQFRLESWFGQESHPVVTKPIWMNFDWRDNARLYRAEVVEDYLKGHSLERMEYSAQHPDLNPIERLCDYLDRQAETFSPPPMSLYELE